ncbi:MAG: TetR/AcrR family transcriptional regulator [Rhodobacteraceae bacterium]|nr:TetR/AcrR family transcriptional regulator [Paracoccaceae bacterium]
MARKAEERKAALRERLLEAASERIARDGLNALRARDLAGDAGCSLGAIYNVYDDLDALVMAVNGRTFQMLGRVVSLSLEGAGGMPPVERLVRMSHAYLGFAAEHTNLWRALFDVEMTDDGPVPDWYREALAGLFVHIAGPVSELNPDMGDEEVGLMTRALFSAVHGIVLLGLQNRISGVPPQQIETMISQVLRRIGNNPFP